MKTSIIVFDHMNAGDTVKTRKVRIKRGSGFPKCQWCKLRSTRVLCSFVVEGTEHSLQTAVCYCDDCHLATIVEFETERLVESEV